MAVRSKIGLSGVNFMPGKPKKTRQGCSQHTKLAASSRNGKKKRYRGQGR
ncbi:hypothetical protein PQC12_gp011 [Synechococcus phage S-SCSM1]|jgi:hypothetical protein|uniref:Uncharacterized protein n=1 Tax=Synechococcus phage S-SCSM1 TaxID=2588487 RepID=A0A6M2ZHS1_9CAUD|nr:hypothetical protein PQC12_gp011 [Synechococcus phage S-SCSM1]QFG06267.1 hypothetical protein SSCSM1_11 [Synechococcus phage S-SCSM1]